MSYQDERARAWADEDADDRINDDYEQVRQNNRAERVDQAAAQQQEEAPDRMSMEDATELAQMVVVWLDQRVTATQGAEFAQTPKETERIVEATAPVIQKWVPASWLLGDWPPEIKLLFVIGSVYFFKVRAAMQVEAERARAAAASENPAPSQAAPSSAANATVNVTQFRKVN